VDYNIGTMSFKDTKVYQEAFEEGRLEGLRLVQTAPHLFDLGLTIEQVAEELGFTINQVQKVKLYHDAMQKGERIAKLKLIPTLLKLGVTVEQVAEAFSFSVEEVRQVAQIQP
jgi:predicted transposase YdaD